jgi:predicted nucleotide-binding protein
MSAIAEKLQQLANAGLDATPHEVAYIRWKGRVQSFLAQAFSEATATEFEKIGSNQYWSSALAIQIGMLEGLVLKEVQAPTAARVTGMAAPQGGAQQHPKRVFVVHGRDVETKESVARFLERLGLEPIILHEQPSSGRTVIEKFEVFSNVGFAVVLLTPDDVGGLATEPQKLTGRARQNVILELGYFLGRLSRRGVIALYKKDVEMPSDYQGVLYVEFDTAGAWRTKLAQELVQAGFSINLDALLRL